MKGFGPGWWEGGSPVVGKVALLLSLALAGCSNGVTASGALVSGAVIDGYTIADPLDCPANGDPRCDEMVRIATETATGERGVAPSAIVGHRLYTEFKPPGTTSGGGTIGIVVFDLADDSRVAVGVYCGVGPCQVVNR
jgi:hypothetical protein